MDDDACGALVRLAERLAAPDPAPRDFLRSLAREGAGIRTGFRAVLDLGRGGRNRLAGRGFRRAYDDGTRGQVRHFCGVARAADLLGARTARFLMVRSGDSEASPDGRLTEAAIEFAGGLRDGRLPVADAAAWIEERICRRG